MLCVVAKALAGIQNAMIETKRLKLRQFVSSDHGSLNMLLGNTDVMKSSDHGTLSTEEVWHWLGKQIECGASKNGIELFAVELRSTSRFIGYCGLSVFQDLDATTNIQSGYRLLPEFWGCGYATEAASAVRDYAFLELQLDGLVALIEPINGRSVRVAEKIGMTFEKEIPLDGYDHPDHLYSLCNGTLP